MSDRRCAVDSCDRTDVAARGWCFKHYKRFIRHGSVDAVVIQQKGQHAKTFEAKTEQSGDCLVWTGSTYRDGYGQISVDGRGVAAHRYAWEQANGSIPDGMDIDHMCWNRACVKVGHLRVATRSENLQNLRGPTARSTTGIRGVSYRESRNQWRAVAIVGGVQHEQTFTTKEEAARAVVEMRRELMPFSQDPPEGLS